jgi:primosomal protein N'
MPCYRCGERQTDPDRGASPWKRGVRDNSQVLVCPACQTGRDWAADLDHCPACSRVHMVRRLGEVECKDCGHVAQPAAAVPSPASPDPVTAPAPGLAEEVAQALDRVLPAHRTPP